jgi:TctA family transporter
MALLMGALMIQGIQPGPRLIVEHPDIFWGLIASFWIGNLMLVFLNVPMISIWVKLLTVPYRYMYPTALFFVCIGVFASRNDMFDVGSTLVFGMFGYLLIQLRFEPAPILLGFVLGPRLEENFRRSLVLSRGSLRIFTDHPISAAFLLAAALLIAVRIYARFRRIQPPTVIPSAAFD